MHAVLPSVGTRASAHAELRGAHEAGPFAVLGVGSEGVTVNLAWESKKKNKRKEKEKSELMFGEWRG